ncbi:MAG: hypothetical protein ACE5DO_13450 [Desulfobacterales bacterium]
MPSTLLKQITLILRYAFVVLFGAACSSDSGLRPFTSDGCTLFPDNSHISADDWCSCCFEHDMAYWRGGTKQEREAADLELKACVMEKTRNEALAALMYEGVRLGGSPYFHNWYRWGYGWDFDRKYQALTPSESERADRLLEEYFSSNTEKVCEH